MNNIDTIFDQTEKMLLERSVLNDADAQNALGVLYMNMAVGRKSISLLDKAEEYLLLAALNGSADAARMLEISWFTVRQECIRQIQDGG